MIELFARLQAEGNLDAAEARYREASRMDPSYLEPLGSLADLHEKRKDWDRAIELRERIIEIVPYRFEAYYNMGLTCADAGLLDKAVENLEQAVFLAPKSPEAWEALGQAYRLAREPSKACDAFRRAQEIDPARSTRLEKQIKALEAGLEEE